MLFFSFSEMTQRELESGKLPPVMLIWQVESWGVLVGWKDEDPTPKRGESMQSKHTPILVCVLAARHRMQGTEVMTCKFDQQKSGQGKQISSAAAPSWLCW